MNYKKHKAGLMLAVLSAETPAKGAFRYCLDHQLVGWREAEKLILRDLLTATQYVEQLRKSRWPALEIAIADALKDEDDLMPYLDVLCCEALYFKAIGVL